MGEMTTNEIRKAYNRARIWLHRYFDNTMDKDNLYEFQLFIVVLAQFLYGTFGTLCDFSPTKRNKHLVIADQLRIKVPVIGKFIAPIIDCRNAICHKSGLERTDELVNRMNGIRPQLGKLLHLLDPFYCKNLRQRLALLKDLYPDINLVEIELLVPTAIWDDPIELLNSLKIIMKDLYNIE